jgi:hypothetical protein
MSTFKLSVLVVTRQVLGVKERSMQETSEMSALTSLRMFDVFMHISDKFMLVQLTVSLTQGCLFIVEGDSPTDDRFVMMTS